MANLHAGHRKRMRERFLKNGLEGFADHEVLELLLFFTQRMRNVNEIAHEAILKFGSLQKVLEAPDEEYLSVRGLGQASLRMMKLIRQAFDAYEEELREEKQRMTSLGACRRYCCEMVRQEKTSGFYLISLSANGNVLGNQRLADGDLGVRSIHLRQVMDDAERKNARCMVLCQYTDCERGVSQQEYLAVWMVQQMLAGVEINLLDYLLISPNRYHSMAENDELLHEDFIAASFLHTCEENRRAFQKVQKK